MTLGNIMLNEKSHTIGHTLLEPIYMKYPEKVNAETERTQVVASRWRGGERGEGRMGSGCLKV